MFPLPPISHKAREAMGDVASVVEILDPKNFGKLLTTMQARRSALEFLDREPAAKRVNTIIVRQDTAERWLISIGRKGGWVKLWNFGNGGAA